jgi:CheY-like chemotaxis protein
MNGILPVLLAEDDPNEAYLMQRAFGDAGVANPLIHVRDGLQAIEYLKGVGPYADRAAHPLPCLMLLDLKMPGMDGFEVLEWLRWHLALHDRLPVLVLTDSYNNADMERTTALGARQYLLKPYSHDVRIQMVRELNECWLTPAQPGNPTPLIAPSGWNPTLASQWPRESAGGSAQDARN